MAKHFFHGKRSAICALSVMLTASLSLGALAACGGETTTTTPDDDTDTTVTSTDTQPMRNGNFEYFSERETKHEDKRSFISSPTSWSFSSGSPSSNTASGIIETSEWTYMAKPSGIVLIPEEDRYQKNTKDLTEQKDGEFTLNTDSQRVDAEGYLCDKTTGERLKASHGTLTEEIAQKARDNWDKLSLYDILEFYDFYEIDSAEEFDLYEDYAYSIDFEDVEYLAEDLGENGPSLHEGVKDGEDGLLMIHNKRNSDNVLGTGQYYSSTTTITLEAGTAAEVTAWVRTDALYHWYDEETLGGEKTEVESRGGAYIGINNTVGGSSLETMVVQNINTKGEWEKYTFYIRGNTYASTTFSLRLGLGRNTSSDNRYEAVDGYAFFDDVAVQKISSAQYEENVAEKVDANSRCDINSTKAEKTKDRDTLDSLCYALDLLGGDAFTPYSLVDNVNVSVTEKDNSKPRVPDNRDDANTPEAKRSIVEAMSYRDLRTRAGKSEGEEGYNGYLKKLFDESFTDKFPFGATDTERDDTQVLLLLSTNGTPYTAELTQAGDEFTLGKNERMLVSFFVKTSEIPDGYLGAGITLVDGTNETSITPFDSTKVSPVDIDDDNKDINKGWVQCFFIVSNETDTEKSFSLKFTYGVTDVASATKTSDYCDGWAAFADFKTMPLTKAQYNYASTGSYAQKVSLTAYKTSDEKFDSAEASSNIKEGLATPSSFRGALAGSNIFVQGGDSNKIPDGVYAGLLNKEYAEKYMGNAQKYLEDKDKFAEYAWAQKLDSIAGTDATTDTVWWNNIFGETVNGGVREARQPLVLMNTSESATPSYGFISRSMTTSISANSTQLISMRVKVAAGTKAYVYLLDTSDLTEGFNTLLSPSLPKYTYWYDDEGNILRCDPESDDFDKKKDVLYYLESNGLYTKASDTSSEKVYYANLSNYDTDDDGNLVTDDGTIAFYFNKTDSSYYGYCDKDGTYTQPVKNLPTEEGGKSILRYTAPVSMDGYAAVIEVEGTAENANKWIEVNFYVRTGSDAKTYRLEVWAGDRTNSKDGFPAGGYVFFDAYSSGSYSDYEATRSGAVEELLEDEKNQSADDAEKLNGDLALYYTFTFYDSLSYLRHDRDHEEVDYNKWEDYKQSSYSEGLVWLKDYETTGDMPSYSYYLDFTPLDVTVTPNEPEETTDTDTDEDEEEPTGDTNIWLVLSSSLLAVVTLLAIGAVVFKAIRKKTKRNKPVKEKKKKRSAPPAPAPEEPAPEPAPKKTDENDPYND